MEESCEHIVQRRRSHKPSVVWLDTPNSAKNFAGPVFESLVPLVGFVHEHPFLLGYFVGHFVIYMVFLALVGHRACTRDHHERSVDFHPRFPGEALLEHLSFMSWVNTEIWEREWVLGVVCFTRDGWSSPGGIYLCL